MNFIQKINELKPDFSWTEEDNRYDVEKNARNPFDCKDELSKQWNGEFVPATPEEGSSKRMREARVRMVQSVRNMMNSGCSLDVIKSRIANNNKKEIVALFQPDIDKQLKLYGSVGRFILDARGYKSCKDAWASAAKNPYRKYFGFILGCGCKEHETLNHMPRKASQGFQLSDSTDMVASCLNDAEKSGKRYQACIPTALVKIAGAGDIDEQWAGDTMIDIMNASSGDKDGNNEKVKSFTASADKPYDRLKKFFIAYENGELKTQEIFNADPEQIFTTVPQSFDIPEPEFETPEVEMDGSRGGEISMFKDGEMLDIEDMDGNKMDIELAKDPSSLAIGYDVPKIEIEISSEPTGIEAVGNDEVDMESRPCPEIIFTEEPEEIKDIGFSNLPQEIQFTLDDEPIDIQF